jgi:hypothetical protein
MPDIHVFLVTLEMRMTGTSPAITQNLETPSGTSNHSFRSFFTLPDAIWARCCSVIGNASSHFRPGSFIT